LLLLVSFGCSNNTIGEQKALIHGYWEIKSVEMADGTTKEFNVNTSVEYLEVNGDSGVRKKLMPRLDGSFNEFPTSEKFTFQIKNKKLIMHYNTPYAQWAETVVKVTDSIFIVKNKDGKQFEYRRFTKIGGQSHINKK